LQASRIRNIEAEAGVIASVIKKPELTFHSEQLKPQHFVNPENVYLYYAACELAKHNVENPKPADVMNMLEMRRGTEHVKEDYTALITIQSIQELMDNAGQIARTEPADYMLLAEGVLDAAFRRHTYEKLIECEKLCFQGDVENIERRITSVMDDVMMEFSTNNVIPEYKDVVEELWNEIEQRQTGECISSYPFKFPTLNDYVMLERGELVIFGAEQKQGKSMMMLNCVAELLKQNHRVMYIDSELSSRLFTCRLISHLTGIPFRNVKSGMYTEEEHQEILKQVEWLKTRSFTHLYMPIFDESSIYTAVKRIYHTRGLDVLCIDYFKGTGEGDAYSVYSSLGKLVDTVKNKICGDLNIAGIGAAQATTSGKLADSAKIARNASTIILIQDKTPEEVQRDGPRCGNKKMIVKFNRNGEQMADGHYIDLKFDGNRILFEEAEQHTPVNPF